LRFHIPEPFDVAFDVAVRVTIDGLFVCILPENVAKLFKGKIELAMMPRGKREGYFCQNTLAGLEAVVKEKLNELCSEKEVSREKVLKFAIETACSYGVNNTGDFIPTAVDSVGGWHDGTTTRDATNRGPYGLRLYCKPYMKITYRYEVTGKERVEYKHLYEHQFNGDVQSDPIQWLSSLHSLDSETSHFGADGMNVQEMPYTNEAGMFFVSLFKWLFSVNERIKPFLNPTGISQLIAMRSGLLLPEHEKATKQKAKK
jgi:hypothetical protein